MNFGIDIYSYHRFLGEVYPNQEPPSQTFSVEAFLDHAKKLGCGGVGIESCFVSRFDQEYLASIRRKLDEYGMDRVYAWGHPDGLEAGGNAKAKDEMIEHIGYAASIGAPVMRVVGSSLMFRLQPHEPQLRILADWFREAEIQARRQGVKLAVENHIDYNADEIKWLVDQIDSEYFGVTFDSGNFLRMLDDPIEAAKKLGPHVYATHIKDLAPVKDVPVTEWYYFSCVPAGTGLIRIKEVAEIFHQNGYKGFLAYETDMPHPDYQGEEFRMVEQSVDYLRKVTGSLK